MKTVCFLLLLVPTFFADGKLVTIPRNVAVAPNETVTMSCATDSNRPVYWLGRDVTQKEIYLCDGYDISSDWKDFIKINKTLAGQFDLIIKANVKTAMTYNCFEPSSKETQSAELILLDTSLNCSSEEIPVNSNFTCHISCSIGYVGNWAPEVNLENIDKIPPRKEKPFIRKNSKTEATFLAPNCDINYTCLTTFNLANKSSTTTALNDPESSRSCTMVPTRKAVSSNSTGFTTPNAPITTIVIIIVCVVLGILFVVVFLIILFRKKSAPGYGKSLQEFREPKI